MFLNYGFQQILDIIRTTNNTVTVLSDSKLLEYYYLSAFLVKPAFDYLINTIESAVNIMASDWTNSTISLLCVQSVILLVIFIILLYAMIHYKEKYNHYSIFYTVLPLNLRKENEDLKSYVKELTKFID